MYSNPGTAQYLYFPAAALVYPGRRDAVWVFLAAVLAYALLPWPKFGPRTLSYSRNRAVIVPDLLGRMECAYADIERVEPAVLALPRWLRIVMMLAALLNWRLMGAIWLGSSQETHGIAIRRKDGTRFNIWLDYLDGSSHVFRELRRANVPMSPQLVQYVDEWLAEFPDAEPWPNANKRKGRLGPVLVVLALTLSLGLHFWPEPPCKVYQESRALSPEVTAQRARLLEEMNQVQIEMNAAMRRYQEGPPKNRMQELDHFTELSNQFDEITKEYDALWSDTP